MKNYVAHCRVAALQGDIGNCVGHCRVGALQGDTGNYVAHCRVAALQGDTRLLGSELMNKPTVIICN
jgi:hypothetical protein